ncbi:DUF2201 family putative metallopeptidase [Limosilactobacillus fermentum]|uniref:DUF2201 family putative metallopeptidase n=1 Tax=Limosilactobacillus fermentum TaxID=1613 RepID=UPI0021A6862F|nr:VWA-like domain-containing protein [Limosilactobacillus fermentum]
MNYWRKLPSGAPAMVEGERQLQAAVIDLLKKDHSAGVVLVNIKRISDPLQSTLNLIWQSNDLVLAYNPAWVKEEPLRELTNLLHHLALHVLWYHPYRYRDAFDPAAVAIATDVAVNQYLEESPAGTVTLVDLERATKQRLPRLADSAAYLPAARALAPATKRQLVGRGVGGERPIPAWVTPAGANPLLMKASLKRLTKGRAPHFDQRGRGTVPQGQDQGLTEPSGSYQTDWVRALRRLMGTAIDGQRASFARFNRRQPYRMDLPGRVSRLVTPVEIFVDQSGSMGDATVARLLKMVVALVHQQGWQVHLTAFDAAIQGRLAVGQLRRLGGGGTRFAAIFEDLRVRRVIPTTPILILTDGAGEEELDARPYQNVLWLLTTGAKLSVQDPPGSYFHLRKDD